MINCPIYFLLTKNKFNRLGNSKYGEQNFSKAAHIDSDKGSPIVDAPNQGQFGSPQYDKGRGICPMWTSMFGTLLFQYSLCQKTPQTIGDHIKIIVILLKMSIS